jgi:hypothetical protein
MKNTKILAVITLSILLQCAYGQGFVNLNFESPFLPLSPTFNTVSAANAIPGWSAYTVAAGTPITSNSVGSSTIFYNTVSLGGAMVALEDNNNISPKPIEGNYSVLLEGSIPAAGGTASIGQNGTIPINAQSITFFGVLAGTLQVTFNNQSITYLITGGAANYNIYTADISTYAGQFGQLLFTAPVNTSALLDNIQFSPSPIPEPSTYALTALGGLLLGRRRWRK